jgi:hypothetical protein
MSERFIASEAIKGLNQLGELFDQDRALHQAIIRHLRHSKSLFQTLFWFSFTLNLLFLLVIGILIEKGTQ